MPAGDVFGLDGFFLNKSNPVVVSTIGINSTGSSAGIIVTDGVLNTTVGIATLTLSTAAGLSTTPFYVGAKIAVSGLSSSTGVAFTGYNGNFVVTGFAGTTTVSYATTGYVGGVTAGITTTGLVMLVTDSAVINTTWSSAQTHGWFGGGSSSTTVDRIDFSNDTGTANIRGPLSLARSALAATGNSNYGWFGGGYAPGSFPAPVYSRVDRIDFSNDSSTVSVRGPLSLARYQPAATGNSNYGWFGGGTTGSRVDRIDFSNDSGTSSPRGPLSTGRSGISATGNSNYGWFGGGLNPSPAVVSTVDRIDFSNDSPTASLRGPLSLERRFVSATANSNYGWFGGGYAPGSPFVIYSTVDRIDFSNDSARASIRGPLTSTRYYIAATGNSNYGWFGGGKGGTPIVAVATVDRIDFSNDSVTASPRGPLSSARYSLAATSGQARSSSTRLQKTGNYGWFGGGYNPGSVPKHVLTVDRIDFSNDLINASPRGSLTLARYNLAATGNSNYGWFGGGSTPSTPVAINVSTVDRIDFSNDSPAGALSRGPLSSIKGGLAATGNSNYGWFGGAIPASAVVDRINFSNDLATALSRSSLISPQRSFAAATGNSNYGWWGGGVGPLSTVERLDFSNDLAATSARGLLNQGRSGLAATGNSNYGWFTGGASNTLDRINFSNDSVTASTRGAFSLSRSVLAATSNSNYGWFGGGYVPTTTRSIVDRIDFSNDLAAASTRNPLSAARYYLAATSNTPT
jgi:hypothetical protein